MKKAVGFMVFISLIACGTLFYNIDEKNIKENQEAPKYCIELENKELKEVKYLCLGYAGYRKYANSKEENLGDSEEFKFGFWFFEKENIIYE